jgi:O-methyltransferase
MSSSPNGVPLPSASTGILAEAYLTLCKEHLTGGSFAPLNLPRGDRRRLPVSIAQTVLDRFGLLLVRGVDSNSRMQGLQASVDAKTMIGMKRLDNLQHCATQVLRDQVPGDLIETGVWRGGASMFMRAILLAYGDLTRTVWVADSFQGLPKPNPDYPADREDGLWTKTELAVSLDEVKANFERYGLLDDRVRFVKGWFSETLPTAPIGQLALLRLDGDMYESTRVALDCLYPKLSVGGFVIVDDYGAIPACRQAVSDFRSENGVREEIHAIDWTGVYWRRQT